MNRQWDYEHLWEVAQHQLLRLLQHQYQKPNVSKSSRLVFHLHGLYRLRHKLQLEDQSLDDQWTRQWQLEKRLLVSKLTKCDLTKCCIVSLWHRFLNEFVNCHIVSLQSWTSMIPTNNALTCVYFFEHLKKCSDRYIDGFGLTRLKMKFLNCHWISFWDTLDCIYLQWTWIQDNHDQETKYLNLYYLHRKEVRNCLKYQVRFLPLSIYRGEFLLRVRFCPLE